MAKQIPIELSSTAIPKEILDMAAKYDMPIDIVVRMLADEIDPHHATLENAARVAFGDEYKPWSQSLEELNAAYEEGRQLALLEKTRGSWMRDLLDKDEYRNVPAGFFKHSL